MNWIPGDNCDVILSHYKHGDQPLIGYRIPSDPIGPRVKVHYETYWKNPSAAGRDEDRTTIRYLWFTALIDDDILCPDGGWFPFNAAETRQKVQDILNEQTDIMIYTSDGCIYGLYTTEHAIIDTVYQGAHTVEVYLSTRELKDIPYTPGSANMWLPHGFYNPPSTWGSAKWA